LCYQRHPASPHQGGLEITFLLVEFHFFFFFLLLLLNHEMPNVAYIILYIPMISHDDFSMLTGRIGLLGGSVDFAGAANAAADAERIGDSQNGCDQVISDVNYPMICR
jgi:hypothetical protein